MADVVLVKLEREKETHGLPPPNGILYVGDALEKGGFSVKLFHEKATPGAISKLVKIVKAEKPIYVGFSNISPSPLGQVQKASEEIKKIIGVPIVWGGVHSTIFPEMTLANPWVDIVVLGEGEEAAVELARALRTSGTAGPDLNSVRGIGFKDGGRPVFTGPRPYLKDLDVYSPAWHLLDINDYIFFRRHFYTDIGSKVGGHVFAMITSRGCPWRCGYCYNQVVNRRTFRAQSPAKVLAEAKKLKDLGVTAIIFEDDNFFTDKKRAMEIVRNLGLPWSCSIRADDIAKWGEDFVRDLEDARCFELRIGAESGSQAVLDIMHKDVTVDQMRRAVALLAKHRIQTMLNFMVGMPGETWEDILRTLDFIDEMSAVSPYVSVSSLAIYAPWPRSPLGEEAVARGFKPPADMDKWTTAWTQRTGLAPFQDRRIKFIGFYRTMVWRDLKNVRFPYLARPLKKIAQARWRRRFFRFPVDYYLPQLVLKFLRKTGLGKVALAIFD